MRELATATLWLDSTTPIYQGAIMTTTTVPARRAGTAAVIGGLTISILGVVAAVDADAVTDTWFTIGGLAIGLLVVGVLGLRTAVADVSTARRALAGSAVAMTLFGLAHLYALLDTNLAILLFSVLMVLASLGMIIAGVALVRRGIGHRWQRLIPLMCGVWPILTIPAGAAIGDLPHFLAIAVWGAWWVALGMNLLTVIHDTQKGLDMKSSRKISVAAPVATVPPDGCSNDRHDLRESGVPARACGRHRPRGRVPGLGVAQDRRRAPPELGAAPAQTLRHLPQNQGRELGRNNDEPWDDRQQPRLASGRTHSSARSET